MKIKKNKPPKRGASGREEVNEVEQLVILFNQFFSSSVKLTNEVVLHTEQLVMETPMKADLNAICIQQQICQVRMSTFCSKLIYTQNPHVNSPDSCKL